MYCKNFVLPIGLLMIGMVWGACVDIPDGPSTNTNPDFRSEVRFINAMPASGGDNVTVDGTTVSNIGFLASSAYFNVASGSRAVGLGSSPAQTVSFVSEKQASVVFYPDEGALSYLTLYEGDKDKNNGKAGVARIKFVNVADGSNENITTHTALGDPALATAAFGTASVYVEIDPVTTEIFAVSVGSYPGTLSGAQEVPPVTTVSIGSATVTQTLAGIPYAIDVRSDNFQGFYTAAHFHNAEAGVNGPVVRTINVNAQQMSMARSDLSGAKEVPPVTTTASGTGTFTLRRNSLTYTIGVIADADTLNRFTMAHFHNADTAASGPIVKTIFTGIFGDSTFTGVWSDTDSEPLTPALVAEIIAGRVYVNFHSLLNPLGIIRAQLKVDSTTTNTFSGTWIPADPEPLTDTLRQEFNLGRIYVNFHNAAHPSGQVRAQLVPDALYGVTSLPSAAYEDGRVYTIILTGAGPGLQATPLSDRQIAAPPSGRSSTTGGRK